MELTGSKLTICRGDRYSLVSGGVEAFYNLLDIMLDENEDIELLLPYEVGFAGSLILGICVRYDAECHFIDAGKLFSTRESYAEITEQLIETSEFEMEGV